MRVLLGAVAPAETQSTQSMRMLNPEDRGIVIRRPAWTNSPRRTQVVMTTQFCLNGISIVASCLTPPPKTSNFGGAWQRRMK